jgi:hypothetical protein
MVTMLPVTQLLTIAVNRRAATARRISWRGLSYQLGRGPLVKLLNLDSTNEHGTGAPTSSRVAHSTDPGMSVTSALDAGKEER